MADPSLQDAVVAGEGTRLERFRLPSPLSFIRRTTIFMGHMKNEVSIYLSPLGPFSLRSFSSMRVVEKTGGGAPLNILALDSVGMIPVLGCSSNRWEKNENFSFDSNFEGRGRFDLVEFLHIPV